MDATPEPFVFRPPVEKAGLRILLGVVLTLLSVGGTLIGAAVVWLPRTLSYEISDGRLTVVSGFEIRPRVREIPLARIETAKAVRLKPGKRIAGTNLPGYCAGHFRFPDLGDCTLATTCSPEVVVLRSGDFDRPLVISPARRQEFLAALTGEGTYRETIHPEASGVPAKWLPLAGLIIIGLGLFVPVIFFIAPGRLRYRVTPGHVEVVLTVTTKRFSISNCIARASTPESSAKIAGSSIPGYYSGLFRVDGMSTRVYATRMQNGVLIEGPDLRLYLSPEDPHAFLEALRALGGMETE